MKVLSLANGTNYEFADESTKDELVTVLTSFAEVDVLAAKLTLEAINNSYFNNVRVENAVSIKVTAESDNFGHVIARLRLTYSDKLTQLEEQVKHLSDTLMNFMGLLESEEEA